MGVTLVAEISANHNGSLDRARDIMREFAHSGADLFKLQTYTPDTMTFADGDSGFHIREGNWAGRTLYDLYEEAHTPWDWHRELFEYGNSLGVPVFSSPFDETAVDFLEELGCPMYKIASFEVRDTSLIRYAARTGKPLVISTGMADLEEIERAVKAARAEGCEDLTLLHCLSSYPAPAKDFNPVTIQDLIDRFDVKVGVSDRSIEALTAALAVGQGAVMIEKHETIDTRGGGPDDEFSCEPEDFALMRAFVDQAFESRGHVTHGVTDSEKGNLVFRRSLYFEKSHEAGETV